MDYVCLSIHYNLYTNIVWVSADISFTKHKHVFYQILLSKWMLPNWL